MTTSTPKTEPPTKAKPKPKRAAIRKPAAGAKGGKALMAAAAAPPPSAAGELPIELLDPTHWTNPRGEVDEDSPEFAELVSSIEATGLLQPIVVGPALVEGGKHPIVAGWRRYYALRKLKATAAPVRQVTLTGARDVLVASAAENRARQDMRPLAEARVIRTLVDEHGMTQVAAGKAIGMSERTTRERLRLLTLPEKAAEAIDTGAVSMEAAVNLQKIAAIAPKVAEQLALLVGTHDDVYGMQYTSGSIVDEQLLLDGMLEAAEQESGEAELITLRAPGGWPSHIDAWCLFDGDILAAVRRRLTKLNRNGVALPDATIAQAQAAGKTAEFGQCVLVADRDWLRPRYLDALGLLEREQAERLAKIEAEAASRPKPGPVEFDEPSSGVGAAQAARDAREKELAAWAHHGDLELGRGLMTGIPDVVDLGDPGIAGPVLQFLDAQRVPTHAWGYVDPAYQTKGGNLVEHGARQKLDVRERERLSALFVERPGAAAAIVLRHLLAAVYVDAGRRGDPFSRDFPDGLVGRAADIVATLPHSTVPARARRLLDARATFRRRTTAADQLYKTRRLLKELDELDGAATGTVLDAACREWESYGGAYAANVAGTHFAAALSAGIDGGLLELGGDGGPGEDMEAIVALTRAGDDELKRPFVRPELEEIDPPGPPPADDMPASGAPEAAPKVEGLTATKQRVLDLIFAKPGVTIPEIAEGLEIKQNGLYVILPDLQKRGLVRKEGRGWHATEAAS